MPIDASIYSQIRPFEMQSPLESMRKAQTLSSLAMQQAKTAKDMQNEDKERALQDRLRKASQFGSALDSLTGLRPEEQPRAYAQVRQQLLNDGVVGEDEMPAEYDPTFVQGNLRKYYQSKEHLERRKTEAEINKLNADANRKENDPMAAYRAEMAAERRQDKLDKKVEGLQKGLSSGQDLTRAIQNIEGKLGYQLEDYDAENDDLPGVSIPGIGRVTGYSDAARELNTSIAKIFNKELRDRSGAAVTTPEMDRLREEFAAGKFNTEKELIGALAQYKAAARSAMEDIERGANPTALREYQERGGTTSQSIAYQPGRRKKETTPVSAGPRSAYAAPPRKNTFDMSEEELLKELEE